MKTTKTLFAALIAIAFMNTTSFAQKGSGNCVSQGTVIIDPFYGYPYFNGAVLKGLSDNPGKIKSYCEGGSAEYLVSDKIGLGMEFTYANATTTYQDTSLLYYTAGLRKIRAVGRLNFHFATTSSIDPYFTIGAGYKQTTLTDSDPHAPNITINLVPVAFRVGVGIHYYFTDFLGINAEVGLGGPMTHLGLSFKF